MWFKDRYEEAIRAGAGWSKTLHRDVNPLGQTVKIRTLYQPNKAMSQVHADIIEYLRRVRKDHVSATITPFSFPPIENLRRHRNSRFFFLLDIHHAYQQVDLDRLVDVFGRYDSWLTERVVREELRAFLRQFFFADEGGLATGLNASPDLFNFYVGKLVDEPLWEILQEHARKTGDRVVYTRYIDDLTLSLEKTPWGSSIRERIKKVIRDAGLTLNRRKTSPTLDIYKGPITFTGLRVQRGGVIYVPRHYIRLMRQQLQKAIRTNSFSGKNRIQHFAGMNGVFWAGTDRQRNLTRAEQEIVTLWSQYRSARKAYLKAHPSP